MAFDLTDSVYPMHTQTVSATGSTWDRVTLPAHTRAVDIVNRTGDDLAVQYPVVASDGGAYATSDDQILIADGASFLLPLSPGTSRAKSSTFNIRTAIAASVHLAVRG